MTLIDSHAHLTDKRLCKDIEQVLARAKAAGVVRIINVGADLKTSRDAVAQAQEYGGLYATVGIHPHDADTANHEVLAQLEELAMQPQVVAWGEIGLDYYYDNSPRDVQRQAFHTQMQLAEQYGLPVIIHDRDAHEDTYTELKKWQGQVKGVLHCYSGSVEMAQQFVQMGYYISIAGPITFNNARKLPSVVESIPLDKLLIETDSPYLTPTPYRGKVNEPSYVTYVAQEIAQIKGIDVAEVAAQTYSNTVKLFNLTGVV